MKTKYFSVIIVLCSVLCLSGCKDYLTEIEPGTTLLSDYFTSTAAAQENLVGCYVPLMWEYNTTYCSEWFIGDIASDDALKGGGSTTDMADAYDFENWRTESSNALLHDFYIAQFQGIARCNLSLKYIANMPIGIDADFTQSMKNRLLGEAYFLRAYYYFRLVRVFAGVPLVLKVVDNTDDWHMPRASVNEIYTQMLSDLELANKYLWKKSEYLPADAGRATKGAAEAMLMKVNLYMGSPYWQRKGVTKLPADCFADAKAWGDSILTSGEYSLCPNYEDNFTITGENGAESVFEIQYAEVTWGDYTWDYDWKGFGRTAGSFTQILTRSRSSKIGGGWGFNHPTQSLYDEFEAGDVRRDVAILVPADSLIETPAVEYYLGNKMLNNKYAMYRDSLYPGAGFGQWGIHASRGPLNNRQIRYADVMLMYAEACIENGDAGTAKTYIDLIRARAGLPGVAVADRTALRHERRCELAMEGHRWFDLVRWEGWNGKSLADYMNDEEPGDYRTSETEEARSHMRMFISGKHEIFPIPYEERILNPDMDQNPGY